MALHSAPPNDKLIFAPANSSQNSRADQYLQGTLSLHDLAPSPFTQFHTWFTAAQAPASSPSPSTTTSTTTPSSDPTPTPTVHQPETVCVSTSALPSGRVSSRYVYLKELDARGFVFYSNWATSRKAADLATNAHASMAFWWREVERQVRVEGRLERLTTEESQRYYDLRARGSRVGAWASRQSRVLEPRVRRRRRADDGEDGADGADGGVLATGMEGMKLVAGQGEGKGEAQGKGDAGVVSQYRNGDDGTEAKDEEVEVDEVDDGRGQLDEWVQEVEERFRGQDQIPVPDFWGGMRLVPDRIEFWQGRNSRLHDRFVYTKLGGEEAEREEGEAGEQQRGNGARSEKSEKRAGEGQRAGEGEGAGWKIERLSP